MKGTTEIVIVGNGFGGTYTLKHLQKIFKNSRKVRLTLVGKKNYFLFTPLLHEVATGGLNPANIIEPVRKIFKSCLDDFYLGTVTKINLAQKTVEVASEEGKHLLRYDYLVLSGGAETNFFNTPGAQDYSLTLKSLEDAVKIKNRVIAKFEEAAHVKDVKIRKQMLSFVVVGGGATGVELAAELIELVEDGFSYYYKKRFANEVSVTLIQKAPELLPQFSKKLRVKSLQVLKRKGVKVLLDTGVVAVDKNSIKLEDGSVLPTDNTIWVAGIKPSLMQFDNPVKSLPDGKILINQNMQLEDYPEVFALGDMAALKQGASYLPALAQVTVKEAKTVAQNIERMINGENPRPFLYRNTGSMISLGQWMAIGQISNFTISGRITWWLWRTVYLAKMISWQKKVKIAVDWTMDIFSPRDISEL